MRYLSIGEAATYLGVAVSTLRRWERNGKLESTYRTIGGHRRYDFNILQKLCGQFVEKTKKVIAYARVSSHDQKADLEVQANRLEQYCQDQQFDNVEVIQDLGSGLNYNKKGFKKLLKMIVLGQIEHLIVVHKDRLLRFGADIIFQLCQLHNIKVTILEQYQDTNLESSLVADVIELMTVFSARLYGSRSHKNKKKVAVNTV